MANGVSTLGQALDQIERLKTIQTQFTDYSAQLATGKKTQRFSGLGQDVLASKRARASFASLERYESNITNANTRIELMLTNLKEFRAQASNLMDALVGLPQESTHQKGDIVYQDDPGTPNVEEFVEIGHFSGEMDESFDLLSRLSGNLFEFMVDLVNEQDGDRYLFSGADSSTKPLDHNTGTLDAAISAALTEWKNEASPTNISTTELISRLRTRDSAVDPNAITDTIVGYSASLTAGTAGDISVLVDDTKSVEYTSLANNQGMRDILVAAAFFKNENLTPMADVYSDPYTFGDVPTENGAPGATLEEQKENFYEVFNSMVQMVHNAMEEMDEEIHRLELAQVRISQAKEDISNQKSMFLNIMSEVEDADTNEIAVKINAMQVTLDASYRVTARIQELSLVNFI